MKITTASKIKLGGVFLHLLIDSKYLSPTFGQGGLWPWRRVKWPRDAGPQRGCVWAVPVGSPPWATAKDDAIEGAPFLKDQKVIV